LRKFFIGKVFITIKFIGGGVGLVLREVVGIGHVLLVNVQLGYQVVMIRWVNLISVVVEFNWGSLQVVLKVIVLVLRVVIKVDREGTGAVQIGGVGQMVVIVDGVGRGVGSIWLGVVKIDGVGRTVIIVDGVRRGVVVVIIDRGVGSVSWYAVVIVDGVLIVSRYTVTIMWCVFVIVGHWW
jgi:hypothetical protein